MTAIPMIPGANHPGRPVKKYAVASLSNPGGGAVMVPEMQATDQVREATVRDMEMRAMVDNGALQDAPPWFVYLVNSQRKIEKELLVLRTVLLERHITNPQEITQITAAIEHSMEKNYQALMGELARSMAQAPAQPVDGVGGTATPSNDPRRAPAQ